MLTTTDGNGGKWCLEDTEKTEAVGSWRGVPCADLTAGTALSQTSDTDDVATALVTGSGAHLAWNNQLGASGPVPHSRYLSADSSRSPDSRWLRSPLDSGAFQLMASDRVSVRDDDKAGGLSLGGDFCLDLVADMDSEVWAGPLASSKWAVALLNRHPTTNSSITVQWSMFNAR